MRASWSITSAYGGGWCVRVTVGSRSIGRWFASNGGEWELLRNGESGEQLVGTCDVRAPRNPERFGRWIRRYLAPDVANLKAEAS